MIQEQVIYQIQNTKQKYGNLYLGNNQSLDPNILGQYKIGAIIKISQQKVNINKNINVKQIILKEIQDLSQQFTTCFQFIDQNLQKSNVLVQCDDGKTLSATMLIAYFMNHYIIESWEALDNIRDRCDIIDINKQLLEQLELLDKTLIAPRLNNIQCCNLIIENKKSKKQGNLYLGSFQSLQLLKQNDIKAIVTILDDNKPEADVQFHYYKEMMDIPGSDISLIFQETYQFIDDHLKTGNVLVHCMMGISRSSTIVIQYLMQKQKMRVGDAFLYVQQRRPIIHPNEGFMQKLYQLNAKLFG
ncbi:hypothetical protein pb186bvf_020745 [Paramecium bursaria]